MVAFLNEFFLFMKTRKKYWLIPVLVLTFLVGAMLVLAQSSAVAPFIYSLF
jgi:hypothetical protein